MCSSGIPGIRAFRLISGEEVLSHARMREKFAESALHYNFILLYTLKCPYDL